MLKRFPDPILMLDDGSILHIELQTANHGKMIAYKDDCRRIEQAVIYLGAAKMNGDLDADALLAAMVSNSWVKSSAAPSV